MSEQRIASPSVRVSGPERLADLGVTADQLTRALLEGDRLARRTSRHDPPILEGLLRWAMSTRSLRDELVPLGWHFDNPRNLARTISPRHDTAIVVTTGDEGVGDPTRDPGTRHAKGSATEWAIIGGQLTFGGPSQDQPGLPFEELVPGPMQTWFLLFAVVGDHLRAELSLPRSYGDGRMLSWRERIMLPQLRRLPPD